MNKLKQFLLTVAVFVFSLVPVSGAFTVHAEDTNLLCDVFPFLDTIEGFGVSGLCGNSSELESSTETIASWVQFGLSLVFIIIIGISVFVIIKGAIKYIRSEGDADKVVDAQKAIKSVFMGVGALFVGLIGVVVIIVVFNATGALEDDQNSRPQIVNDILDSD